VQFAAWLADQPAVKDCPALIVEGLKVMFGAGGGGALYAISSTGLPGTTRLPEFPGSSTD
jgi:hypothetical protein